MRRSLGVFVGLLAVLPSALSVSLVPALRGGELVGALPSPGPGESPEDPGVPQPRRQSGGCRLPIWLEPVLAHRGGAPGRALLGLARRRVRAGSAKRQLLVRFEGLRPDGAGSPLLLVDCRRGRALVFLHIPKNAGSHIESVAHSGGVLWGAVKVRSTHLSERVYLPDGNTCSAWHVPPYLYKGPLYRNSDVFCVIRDPAARAVSEYRWRQDLHWQGTPSSCDEGVMSRWVENQVRLVQTKKFHNDCHWVPQVDFVRNPYTHKRTCNVMLKLSNLEYEFNQLMKSRGLTLRMQPTPHVKNKAQSCPFLSHAQLSPTAMALIRSTYGPDYDLLAKAGFKPRQLLPPGVAGAAPQSHAPRGHAPQNSGPARAHGAALKVQPGLCLRATTRQAAGYAIQSGDLLSLGRCHKTADQSFAILKDNTVRLHDKPGLCLSAFLRSSVAQVGDQVGLYPCIDGPQGWSQKFVAPMDGTIRLAATHGQALCLSVFLQGDEAAPADQVGLYTCTGAWNQIFTAATLH